MSSIPKQDRPDSPVASRLLGTSIAAWILASTCVLARLWFRHRISRLGVDDFFVLVALILSTSAMVLASNCLESGMPLRFKPPSSFLHVMFFFYDLHVWAAVMIKTSLSFMLLRFHQERAWRLLLYTLLAIQAMVACASTLTNYLRCKPVEWAWIGETSDGNCMGEQGTKTWMWLICVFSIITDVIYTTVPLADIRHLDRSLRERLALCLLMSIGLLATAASIVKISVISYAYNRFGDTHSLSDLMLCSLLELFLGVVGACLPCLKQCFERALYWTKRKTICLVGERVDSVSSSTGGRRRDEGEERDFGCKLGLGGSTVGSENSIPLAPVLSEDGVVMLDGLRLGRDGNWERPTLATFGAPRSSQLSSDGQFDDAEGDGINPQRAVDLVIQIPGTIAGGGLGEERNWPRGSDAFQWTRCLPDEMTEATQQALEIIKTTCIEVVEEEKPVGWEDMEVVFGIKRIWAEQSCH